MTIKYIIEIWDPKSRRYIPCWEGENINKAYTMYDKPYYSRHTRRMVRIESEILFKDKKP